MSDFGLKGALLHTTEPDSPQESEQGSQGQIHVIGTVMTVEEVVANLNFLELDGLVVIGGDDTLSYAAVLAAKGVPVWGIPKTMDNDVPGNDYCISFRTAITQAMEFINRMRSTAGSHSETILFRLFGRGAGFTAFETAVVTWADRLLIPEVPAHLASQPNQCTTVNKRRMLLSSARGRRERPQLFSP